MRVSVYSSVSNWAVACLMAIAAPLLGGCTTTSLLLGAAGVASDTSVTWEVVKHLHAKMTAGDDTPCVSLNSAQRALSPRCGAFVPGSLLARDVRNPKVPECPLAMAVRDPRLWATVPEFLDKGAQPEACARSPLLDLAQLPGCPEFTAASPEVLRSLTWLAEADTRAVRHDVVHMLSCPSARAVGLDRVLQQWLAQGAFDPGTLSFAPLGALHPDYLVTPFAQALEARGHTARDALGAYDGVQPGGFEEALRLGHWSALDWWLVRLPQLANRVPAFQGNQLDWLPLARVITPGFLADPESQAPMVEFLMARGANPRLKLPFDGGRSVLQYARALHSPVLHLLDPPPLASTVTTVAVGAVMPGQ